jgi:hypothetical protein
VIKASASSQIAALTAGLASPQAATREAAVARLTVIGERAVSSVALVAADAASPRTARLAALAALEAIADLRGVDAAIAAVRDADLEVACAGASVLRGFLRGPRSADAVDALAEAALAGGRPEALRLTAIRSLADLAPATIKPIAEALASDPSDAVKTASAALGKRRRGAATKRQPEALPDADSLADHPDLARAALARTGASMPLAALHHIVEQVREREQTAGAADRPAWLAVRAAAHAALARRGSRVALYDIRETLERTATPLPIDMIAALSQVGDSSVLDSIAGAYARAIDSGAGKNDWWPRHLADVFRTIAKREKLTRRHGVMKKIAARWKQIAGQLM